MKLEVKFSNHRYIPLDFFHLVRVIGFTLLAFRQHISYNYIKKYSEKSNCSRIYHIYIIPGDGSRPRPILIDGSEERFECDTVISAIGQGPDLKFISEDAGGDIAEFAAQKQLLKG